MQVLKLIGKGFSMYSIGAAKTYSNEEMAQHLGGLLHEILVCLTSLTRLSLEYLCCQNVFPKHDVGCLTNLR